MYLPHSGKPWTDCTVGDDNTNINKDIWINIVQSSITPWIFQVQLQLQLTV